ncbi:MAG TPA: carboxymuconolactone decarboxylase family protein [Xanthobacteraceae bacterium]|nr:carboxymuconolactone decarboxylase family protein [Xanthobacteraceae bacterium]
MRIPDWKPEDLSPAQRKVHDAIVAGPRGKVIGPLRVWLMSPKLAERAQELGAFCRYNTSLPPRLSELAILVTGAFWKAGFEWQAHAPIALEAGVPAEAIEAIRLGKAPKFARQDENAVYEFSRELWTQRQVSDATYRRIAGLLGNESVVELVGILGYYGLISMTINAFEVPLPEGAGNPFS